MCLDSKLRRRTTIVGYGLDYAERAAYSQLAETLLSRRETGYMNRIAPLLILATAVPVVALPAAADAKGGGARVTSSKSCVGGGVAKLKAANEDGRIEIEFEVDVNRNNQRWNVVIKRNGAKVYSAAKRTAAPSGSFKSHKLIGNVAGKDRISAVATGPNGRSCKVSLSY
jgi:hypothetical protein